MNIATISLDRVALGDRLRAVDEDYAQLIAESMRADGQRTPIEVQAAGNDGRYRLIAGAHRVRAAAIAGLETVLAVVLKVSDLHAQRLEVEENLCRHELTELDRSSFLARWKEIYEALHEEVRHGGRRTKGSSGQDGHLSVERFSAAAAERLGLSERTIRRATLRFRGLAPDVRERISGTWLARNGSELDLLARLRPELQRQVIELAQSRGATTIKPLRDQVLGLRAPVLDIDQQQFDALVRLWRKSGALARKRFIAELERDAQFNLAPEAS